MNAKLAKAVQDLDRAINLDPEIVRQYKKNRAENPGLPASYALRWAKATDASDRPDGFNVRGDSFVVDGFDIEITYDYDGSNDYSHLGEFTNTWSPNAIENPEARNDNRVYRYFVPMTTEREHFEGLHKMGMAKSVAHEKALHYVLEDLKSARDYVSFVITVDASKEGIELGHDYLGGVDESYVEDAVIEHGMIDNAISEAREKLAKLTAPVSSES